MRCDASVANRAAACWSEAELWILDICLPAIIAQEDAPYRRKATHHIVNATNHRRVWLRLAGIRQRGMKPQHVWVLIQYDPARAKIGVRQCARDRLRCFPDRLCGFSCIFLVRRLLRDASLLLRFCFCSMAILNITFRRTQ